MKMSATAITKTLANIWLHCFLQFEGEPVPGSTVLIPTSRSAREKIHNIPLTFLGSFSFLG